LDSGIYKVVGATSLERLAKLSICRSREATLGIEMLTTVTLYGPLGKEFGRGWKLNVSSPSRLWSKSVMSKFLMFAVVASLSIAMAETAYTAEREKETYVGCGRYAGEGRSVDDEQLRQRSDEYSERQYDRQRSEERYERTERIERDYDYRDRSEHY
jgi:hypothetical protein